MNMNTKTSTTVLVATEAPCVRGIAAISWLVDNCPAEYEPLIEIARCYSFREPMFVPYVPDSMLESHKPRVAITYETVNGGVVYIA